MGLAKDIVLLQRLGSGGGGGGGTLNALIDRKITEITNNEVTSIGANAFYGCTLLAKVTLPQVTSIGENAFYGCTLLAKVTLPQVTSIGKNAFCSCESLEAVTFTEATTLDRYSFDSCSALTTADFPKVTSIGKYAFSYCGALKSLILRNETVCELLGSNDLSDTPIANGGGYIYVPSALLSTYQSATNWSTYAGRFRALEDYTVDGTITGELDRDKIQKGDIII